jgi:Restriction endonuclease
MTSASFPLCHTRRDVRPHRERPQERFLVSPDLSEEWLAEALARMGGRVGITPYSADEGPDIVASLATLAAPLLILEECERYGPTGPVGGKPITRLWTRLFDEKGASPSL